jgi:hypothetical protein
MESRTRERAPSDDAVEFVRFCYRRRRVGWPELYDEMCAVAGRGLFRGWGSDELSSEGIGFSLFEMPALATLVHRVVAEDHERRAQSAPTAMVRTAQVAASVTPANAAPLPAPAPVAADSDVDAAAAIPRQLAGAAAVA